MHLRNILHMHLVGSHPLPGLDSRGGCGFGISPKLQWWYLVRSQATKIRIYSSAHTKMGDFWGCAFILGPFSVPFLVSIVSQKPKTFVRFLGSLFQLDHWNDRKSPEQILPPPPSIPVPWATSRQQKVRVWSCSWYLTRCFFFKPWYWEE